MSCTFDRALSGDVPLSGFCNTRHDAAVLM